MNAAIRASAGCIHLKIELFAWAYRCSEVNCAVRSDAAGSGGTSGRQERAYSPENCVGQQKVYNAAVSVIKCWRSFLDKADSCVVGWKGGNAGFLPTSDLRRRCAQRQSQTLRAEEGCLIGLNRAECA